MGQQLKGPNDQMSYVVRSRTVQRLMVNIFFAVNTVPAPTTLSPDFKSIKLTAVLRRNGKDTTLFSDNAAILLKESGFLVASECFFNDGAGELNSTVGTVQTYLLAGHIDLGMPINLKGEDTLTIEGSVVPSWLGTVGNPISYIDFQMQDSIGVEKFIPKINSRTIQGGSAREDFDLGDNVTAISFISAAQTSVGGIPLTATNAVITNLKISSDKYDRTDNFERMITRRFGQFQTRASANLRGRCFQYNLDKECDSTRVELLLNPTNVIAGDYSIVWRSFHIDPETFRRGDAIEQRHEASDMTKLVKAGV